MLQTNLTNGAHILSDDDALFYADQGQGRPIVLLHGWGADHSSWRPIIDVLADNHRVIAVDLPGHGRSPAPVASYTLADVSNRLRRLIETLDLPEPPVVMGHSFGGMVASRFAVDHRDALAALVVVDADLNTPGAFRQLLWASGWATAWTMRLSARFLGESRTLALVPPLLGVAAYSGAWRRARRAGLAEIGRRFVQTNTVEGLIGSLLAYSGRPDLSVELPAVAPRALLLRGSKDLIVSQGRIEALAAAIPGATLRILPGAGHMSVIEQPKIVARHVHAFLRELDAGQQEPSLG